MTDIFCKIFFSFSLLVVVGHSCEANAGNCYETSSRVTSAALIRNTGSRKSRVCTRLTPNISIESKGECSNGYCPVVLDGSTSCGRRGWIHKSLLKSVTCSSSTTSSLAPESSVRPDSRSFKALVREDNIPVKTKSDVTAVDLSETQANIAVEPVSRPQARPEDLNIRVEPAQKVTLASTTSSNRIACYESQANYLNVRYQAGLRNRVCGKMMRGDKLTSKGDCADGWCPVEIKNCGGRGWISQRFLESGTCDPSEVSTDFGLSAGVYWEDESFSGIEMRSGRMGQNNGGQSCTAAGIKQSRCQRLIKMNAHAALGMCLPDGDAGNIEELLEKYNISVSSGRIPGPRRAVKSSEKSNLNLDSSANSNLRRVLSKVLLAFDSIGEGVPNLENSNGINIIFDNGRSVGGPSRRYGNQIQLRRGGQNRAGCAGHSSHGGVDNVALIVHELGHYIGNPSGYNGLMRATGGKHCMVSNYADNNAAEHFSEVLTAYMLLPERFIGKGAACDKAFNYMKQLFGEPDMTKSCIARKRSYTIPGSGQYDENNNLQESGSID